MGLVPSGGWATASGLRPKPSTTVRDAGAGEGRGRWGSDGVRTAEGEGRWGTCLRTRTHLSAILITRASRALQGKGCRRHLKTNANRRGRRPRRLEVGLPPTSGLGTHSSCARSGGERRPGGVAGGGGGGRRRRREKRAHESSGTEVRRHASWSQPRKSALTRLRHTACVSGCLPARVSWRSQTANAVHTNNMKQELIGRRHAHANARRRVSVPMVLGESRASETNIGVMSAFTSSEWERRAEAQVA
jgi:hypothetical protein